MKNLFAAVIILIAALACIVVVVTPYLLISGASARAILCALIALAGAVVLLVRRLRKIENQVMWYRSILDAIPFMIHATDLDMNWTFMNRATADFLNLNRNTVMGMHCSHWNAEICNTERCSAYGLKHGQPTTFFSQDGMDLRVDTSWALDRDNNRMGFVEIVQNISSMVELQKAQTTLVSDIRHISQSFTGAADNIANTAQILAAGTQQQAASTEELTQLIAQITGQVDSFAETAGYTLEFMSRLAENVEIGSEKMKGMVLSVDAMKQSGESIRKVIKIIEDISSQTRLLALNASVEAARVGSAGAGFAIVAEQIGYLANQTTDSVQSIRSLIMHTMDTSERNHDIAEDAAAGFSKITSDIAEFNPLIDAVASNAAAQTVAVRQVYEGLEQVSRVVQQNNAIGEESAAASEQLAAQSHELQNLLDNFSEEYADVSQNLHTHV